ncbi:MAG: T9SS type A sorting domain-containing protein [Flavobacterium sp.]|uniref:T9SS type A sorting domain-containing protein n=1 Tax=Flavobacterium sp. TaxID=239 RepID=UPI0026355342|nr:T9SS type A sorting domain-containing protein [Flavobacterium sp.]MDD5149705.1 T9SS type A sorting domain-containing protein [Flavobacterium sp.]
MKKIFTFILFVALLSNASAQILTRSENWPNVNWTVSGTYTTAAVVFNPTVDAQFKYDAALAIPLGGSATVFIESPVFSLKTAFDGGEKAFKIDVNIAYQTSANDALSFQYWDADSSTWIMPPDGSAPADTAGDFASCTKILVDISLDFSGFTTNQLTNFRYRFVINDAGGQVAGVCLDSPILNTFSCLPPTNLTATNIGLTNATLDWTSSGTNFEIEYGLQGFTLGTGMFQQSSTPPLGLSGLTSGITYDFYVRDNCSNSQAVKSSWAGPQSFTTTSLGLEEQALKGFKLYPNPTKNIISMDSEKVLNEVKVFNLAGKELMKLKPNKAQTNVDLSALASGFYFIKVTTDSDSGTYKVLKN